LISENFIITLSREVIRKRRGWMDGGRLGPIHVGHVIVGTALVDTRIILSDFNGKFNALRYTPKPQFV